MKWRNAKQRLKPRNAPPRKIKRVLNVFFYRNLANLFIVAPAIARNYAVLKTFRSHLAEIGAKLSASGDKSSHEIAALHFVYGLKQVENLPFTALMAIVSAQVRHPRATVFFYCEHEPEGKHWAWIKPRVQLVKIPHFDWFGVAKIIHYAHKADIVRLFALYHVGGLYLDCDTITLRNMDDLAAKGFVMGVQQAMPGSPAGFCNAIMMAQRNSRFGARWLKAYRSFRSRGRDTRWDFHSVKLPIYLYSRNPGDLHVLDHDAWFFPLWPSIEKLLFSNAPKDDVLPLFDDQRAIHLWHNMIGQTLDAFSYSDMIESDAVYAQLCRSVILELPEVERNRLAASIAQT